MAIIQDGIDDWMEGRFVPSFEDGETRTYEFASAIKTQAKDFDGSMKEVMRCMVRRPEDKAKDFKIWDVKWRHRHIIAELKNGNGGRGWTVMQITRTGQNKQTRYSKKGIK